MDRIPMTVQGAKQLRNELNDLKNVQRSKITQAIAEARAHGDLKENAEYHAAREQQGLVEARIRELEYKLSHAQIIDVTELEQTGRVVFGTTVQVYDVDKDEELQFHIVGEDEADITQGQISITSPIARGLIGKTVDDEVVINVPQGEVTYEIIKVEYI